MSFLRVANFAADHSLTKRSYRELSPAVRLFRIFGTLSAVRHRYETDPRTAHNETHYTSTITPVFCNPSDHSVATVV